VGGKKKEVDIKGRLAAPSGDLPVKFGMSNVLERENLVKVLEKGL